MCAVMSASAGHLAAMPPPIITLLLESCLKAGESPAQPWLDELYAMWPVRDAAAPAQLQHTLRLLQLLGQAGAAPPVDWLDEIYFAVCHGGGAHGMG